MDVIYILKNYNKINSKIKSIKDAIEIIKLETECATDELKAQALSDMPKGSGATNSKTENICLGKECNDIKIKKLNIILRQEQQKIEYFHTRLKELNEKERFVLVKHFVEMKTNKSTLSDFISCYGYYITYRQYQNIKRNAIQKLKIS